MNSLRLRQIWEVWKKFGLFMGNLVGRVILTIFYFTIFLPFGIGTRLFADPLLIKKSSSTPPYWNTRTSENPGIAGSRRLT